MFTIPSLDDAPEISCSILSCVYLDSIVTEQIIFRSTYTNLLLLFVVKWYNGDVIQREFQLPLMLNMLANKIDAIDDYNSLPR
jgi:hypothetical protein